MVLVRLTQNAFLELIRASWGKYPKEDMGALFGYKIKNSGLIYAIESVHPYSEAVERRADRIEISDKAAIKGSWTIPTIEQEIGGYHSHPYMRKKLRSEKRTTPSDTDFEDFFNDNPDFVSLIISMSPIRAYSKISENPLRLSGTIKVSDLKRQKIVARRLHLSIIAYHWEKSIGDRGRIRRAELEVVPKEALNDIFNNNHNY